MSYVIQNKDGQLLSESLLHIWIDSTDLERIRIFSNLEDAERLIQWANEKHWLEAARTILMAHPVTRKIAIEWRFVD